MLSIYLPIQIELLQVNHIDEKSNAKSLYLLYSVRVFIQIGTCRSFQARLLGDNEIKPSTDGMDILIVTSSQNVYSCKFPCIITVKV